MKTITFTKEEIDILISYIEFMEEFDDDPSFRLHAESALKKLESLEDK